MQLNLVRMAILFIATAAAIAHAEETQQVTPELRVPEGFSIELVAGAPLVERPITAAFDDEGRLYVAESSGSNDPVEKQLEERPHRIVRLEDGDGDGHYDRRTIFADRMMFPEGTMFLDGSLYVSAPPSIWKLTDADGDGVAEQREEWFQGKTLTHCANDLHGPYAGPDGWIYWCKGAFAEQVHQVHGREFRTTAAHIFRCRPDGTGFEPVMTGGMDNPVDVVFTPQGERIFSATFLEGNGRRDGLAHAIYGGVYGKEHGVLDGHPRTGPLMPALVLMSPTAPSGLERYESTAFGEEYADNLFAAQFNMRAVSRHALKPRGSSFVSSESDFVWSDAVDFHPTDVLMDADGSLLVVDTGGWYKLCCPTSQLWKPDVLGGIYRVRRSDAKPPTDPRGLQLDWQGATVAELWDRLGDARSAVRNRAGREFAQRRGSAELADFLAAPSPAQTLDGAVARDCDSTTAALARAWALVQVELPASKTLVRELLRHPEPRVRQVALQGVSLHRDRDGRDQLREILKADNAPNRRLAAEALGRLGDSSAAPALLDAAALADDRMLRHSITYALIELADADATRRGFSSEDPGTVAAALVAVDQMPSGGLAASDVIPRLSSPHPTLRETARWLASRRPEWGSELSDWFRAELAKLPAANDDATEPAEARQLEEMLGAFVVSPPIQGMLGTVVADARATMQSRRAALRVMERAGAAAVPTWGTALAGVLQEQNASLTPLAVAAAARLTPFPPLESPIAIELRRLADDEKQPIPLRVAALAPLIAALPELPRSEFELLLAALSDETPVGERAIAVDALTRAPLTAEQLLRLCDVVRAAGPLELNKLMAAFGRSSDERVGRELLAAIRESPGLPSLRLDLLRQLLASYGPEIQHGAAELEAVVNVDAATQRARIDELLPHMTSGDVRRGHAVFTSAKATCSACHRMGYAGGTTGPELTKVGGVRTERDLLEAILFPSLSFVQSYEPMVLATDDGRMISGVIRDATESEYVVATGPNEEVRIPRDSVEEVRPGTTSVMPAGLDKQLSVQELADLVAFLRNAK